jgi:hypothetical protein
MPEETPAQPSSGGSNRKPMTPSERARHASLVRWGKEQPFAARLEAVRQRRKAAKQKKASGGKGKKPKAAKSSAEQRAAEKEAERAKQMLANVANVGDALNEADNATLSKNGLAGLISAANGGEPGSNVAQGLIDSGLAVRGEDGRYRLTSDGQAIVRAAESGDTNSVLNKLSEVNDKNVAKGEKEKVKEEKGGGGGGGKEKPTEEEKEAEKVQAKAEKRAQIATQMMENDEGLSERGLETLAALTRGDEIEDENLAKGLVEMGLAEVDSEGRYRANSLGRQAVRAAERGDYGAAVDAVARGAERKAKQKERDAAKKERQAERRRREDERRAREDERRAKEDGGDGEGRRERDDSLPRDHRKRTGNQGPTKPKYGLYGKAIDTMNYAAVLEDLQALRDEIADLATEDDTAIKAGKRNSGADQGLIDQGYALAEQLCELFETLGATVESEGEEIEGGEVEMMEGKTETIYGSEIKALDGDAIGGFAVLFGDESTPDLSEKRDYFTKTTDYWLDRFGWPRPMTYHHGIDEDTRDDPIVGVWNKAVVKDEGIWLEGQLDRAHRYHGAIKELVRRGYLKLSSDSAPQWVIRERRGSAHEVKRWPLLTASPTVTPAEPRLSGLAFKALVAELGLSDIQDNSEASQADAARSDETKAAESDRMRKLLLQSRLLALQE